MWYACRTGITGIHGIVVTRYQYITGRDAMCEELEYEDNLVLDDMKRGETVCRYLDEDEYKDESSHNEIDECQRRLSEKIEEYLRENKPGEYIVSTGWCVFVMTVEEAKKRN